MRRPDARQRRRFADQARKRNRGSRQPGPAQAARFDRDNLLIYTPPESDGVVERQPVLGGGGVARDMIDAVGVHFAKATEADALRGVTGLWTVRARFVYEDMDKEAVRTLNRRITVSIPPNASPEQRRIILARAITQMGRHILEHDYEVGMALTLDDVWTDRQDDEAEESPPRPRRRVRDRARDRGRPRKGAAKKKAAPKKASAKKAAPKKASAKKAAPKKASAKKAAPKKATSKKATPKKARAKKATPKKATPKKATSKKATPKKATPEKATPKKATPKKATPKKATPKKRAAKTSRRRA